MITHQYFFWVSEIKTWGNERSMFSNEQSDKDTNTFLEAFICIILKGCKSGIDEAKCQFPSILNLLAALYTDRTTSCFSLNRCTVTHHPFTFASGVRSVDLHQLQQALLSATLVHVSCHWVGGVLGVFAWEALNIYGQLAITGSRAVSGSPQCFVVVGATHRPAYNSSSHVGRSWCHWGFILSLAGP